MLFVNYGEVKETFEPPVMRNVAAKPGLAMLSYQVKASHETSIEQAEQGFRDATQGKAHSLHGPLAKKTSCLGKSPGH